MRLVLDHGRCCPSQLRRGEAKRVPKNVLFPAVGFYIGCPQCERPQTITSRAVDERLGQDMSEDPATGLVNIGPSYTCDRCGASFRVERGEIIVL